jgi:hypothetical protein
LVRGEVPPEQNQHAEADKKCKRRSHSNLMILTLL